MYNYKTLICSSCNSVILNLPIEEIQKLDGLSFTCEYCGHRNLLDKFEFKKKKESDTLLRRLSYESLLGM